MTPHQGSLVRLRWAPAGEPGVVVDERRGKLVVRWNDLDMTTSHSQDALIPVDNGRIDRANEVTKGYHT